MSTNHWLDYANTDHRSGAWTLEQIQAEERERAAWQEECRGRRRLLGLALAAWAVALGVVIALSNL